MRELTSRDLVEILTEISEVIEQNKEYLSDLDGAIGDGDHGVSMTLGWRAVREKLDNLDSCTDVSEPFKLTGLTLLSSVGAAMGPLYGSGFISGAGAISGKDTMGVEEITKFLEAFSQGVIKRGKAQVGDKTMVDTIVPITNKLRTCLEQDAEFSTAVQEAILAGDKGMKSTINLVAKVGRASRLGDRTIGHQDAGATSAYITLKCFLQEALNRMESRRC